MSGAFEYDWLVSALVEKDMGVTAKVVQCGPFRLLVATRGAKFCCLPVEGISSTKFDKYGGITASGEFWLGAEGDEVRARFVELALRQLGSKAVPEMKITSPFLTLFGRPSEGDDD